MQTIEQRLDQLERRNRRLTAALALMVVAICAVVTMAATGDPLLVGPVPIPQIAQVTDVDVFSPGQEPLITGE